MRAPEWPDRQPEPVTPAVMRKLRRAVTRAERIDREIHAAMGLQPSGTLTVPVRWSTLNALLAAAGRSQVTENKKVLPDDAAVRIADPRILASSRGG